MVLGADWLGERGPPDSRRAIHHLSSALVTGAAPLGSLSQESQKGKARWGKGGGRKTGGAQRAGRPGGRGGRVPRAGPALC